jgi:hypothetical protein
MKKLLLGLAALPFIASVAMAGQPTRLSDNQMDKVTAGNLVIVLTPGIPDDTPLGLDSAPGLAPNTITNCTTCGTSGLAVGWGESRTTPPVAGAPSFLVVGATLSAI